MINAERIYLNIIHFNIISPFTRCSRYWLFMQMIESEYRLYLVNLLKSEIWMDIFLVCWCEYPLFSPKSFINTFFFFIIFKIIFREQDQQRSWFLLNMSLYWVYLIWLQRHLFYPVVTFHHRQIHYLLFEVWLKQPNPEKLQLIEFQAVVCERQKPDSHQKAFVNEFGAWAVCWPI